MKLHVRQGHLQQSGGGQVEQGRVNPGMTLAAQGFGGANVFYNLPEARLVEEALARGEGRLGLGGVLHANTGHHTGRSPKDKFVTRTATTEDVIWWEANGSMPPEGFARLREDMFAHAKGLDLFVQDLHAGADPLLRLNVRIVTQLAWHSLFVRHLLRRPEAADLDDFVPEYTLLNLPGFKADPERHGCRSETVIAFDFDEKLVLVA